MLLEELHWPGVSVAGAGTRCGPREPTRAGRRSRSMEQINQKSMSVWTRRTQSPWSWFPGTRARAYVPGLARPCGHKPIQMSHEEMLHFHYGPMQSDPAAVHTQRRDSGTDWLFAPRHRHATIKSELVTSAPQQGAMITTSTRHHHYHLHPNRPSVCLCVCSLCLCFVFANVVSILWNSGGGTIILEARAFKCLRRAPCSEQLYDYYILGLQKKCW